MGKSITAKNSAASVPALIELNSDSSDWCTEWPDVSKRFYITVYDSDKKPVSGVAVGLETLEGVNSASVMGLLLSLGTSIAMIPLFSQMDRKGKMMNAAFSVRGGQLGFISSVVDGNGVIIYMISKIIAGLLAIVFVLIFYREEKVSVDAMEK